MACVGENAYPFSQEKKGNNQTVAGTAVDDMSPAETTF
jgi:hypothetical protein